MLEREGRGTGDPPLPSWTLVLLLSLLAFIHLWWLVNAARRPPPPPSVPGYLSGPLAAPRRMPAAPEKYQDVVGHWLKVGRAELPPRKWRNGSGCAQPK